MRIEHRKNRLLPKHIIFVVCLVLLFAIRYPLSTVNAQESQEVTHPNIIETVLQEESQEATLENTNQEPTQPINKIKLQATVTPSYIIGPGDGLTIIDRTLREVFGLVETYNVNVSADGYISIPLPDGKQANVLAAGSSLESLSQEIRNLFGKTLKNPLVFVQISKYRNLNIYIGGAVIKPGVYKIDTIQSADGYPLTQAIQLAGGLTPRADISTINVIRGSNSEKKVVSLIELLVNNDIANDLNLQPGDAVYVPISENPDNQAKNFVKLLGKLAFQEVSVNVVGEVKTPGHYSLSNESTILDAIGKAGGINEIGTLKKIKLSRFDDDGIYRTHKLNVHALINTGTDFDALSLRPNDTIEFEPSKGKLVRNFLNKIAPNLVSIATGSTIGAFGSFVVQDNLFNRITRGMSAPSSSSAGSASPITVLGKNRIINNEENK